ncbi:hypothetical protein [Vibrio parahaemolyticus]|uniref:hypothetical protein n=1 Tax=Vibrio parahaemolyticus TaxID=670 RepID=UPI001121D2D2|nr:hypothetical protein [Vibrio parahaemolyticus]TOA07751.1 hypothetical protein CGK35_04165 [Vibrio parahaemolyticus]
MQVKNKQGKVFEVSEEHYETYKRELEPVGDKPKKEVKKKVANSRKTKTTTETPTEEEAVE